MSKGDTAENDVIKIMFLNSYDPSWRTQANLYVSLHTADPGEAGTQLTNEATYTNYARVAVVKTASGWTVAGSQASNAGTIVFPQCGATGATITHVAIGTAASGAGQILYSGALNSPLAVANLIQPMFDAGALVASED